MFALTNLTSGQKGAQEFERIIAPDSPEIPACVNNSAGGLSYTNPVGKNVTIQPTDSRFSVQIYDNGGGIVDSNGFYVCCKFDQWFGKDYPKITAQMRLNSPNNYKSGDIVWCQSYATTDSSPTSTDDGFLLLQPIQEVQGDVVSLRIACCNTWTTSSISTGPQTVTPNSMQDIFVGATLLVDVGSVNFESVIVTGVTGSTFDAVFLNNHTTTLGIITIQGYKGTYGFPAKTRTWASGAWTEHSEPIVNVVFQGVTGGIGCYNMPYYYCVGQYLQTEADGSLTYTSDQPPQIQATINDSSAYSEVDVLAGAGTWVSLNSSPVFSFQEPGTYVIECSVSGWLQLTAAGSFGSTAVLAAFCLDSTGGSIIDFGWPIVVAGGTTGDYFYGTINMKYQIVVGSLNQHVWIFGLCGSDYSYCSAAKAKIQQKSVLKISSNV